MNARTDSPARCLRAFNCPVPRTGRGGPPWPRSWCIRAGGVAARRTVDGHPALPVVVLGGCRWCGRSPGIVRREAGTDLLAGMSIVTAGASASGWSRDHRAWMLAGARTGGGGKRPCLEVLDALARRAPTLAHRMTADGLATSRPPRSRSVTAWSCYPMRSAGRRRGRRRARHDGRVVPDREPYVIEKFPGSAVMSERSTSPPSPSVPQSGRPTRATPRSSVCWRRPEQERPRMRAGWPTGWAVGTPHSRSR
jgi:hypothetical protein